MRRPLTALAFSQAAGILLAAYTELTVRHLCIGIGAFFAVFWGIARGRFVWDETGRKRAAAVLVCAAFFSLGFLAMAHAEAKGSPLLAAAQESGNAVQSFEGLVVHASFKSDRWDLTVRTAEEKVLAG